MKLFLAEKSLSLRSLSWEIVSFAFLSDYFPSSPICIYDPEAGLRAFSCSTYSSTSSIMGPDSSLKEIFGEVSVLIVAFNMKGV